MDWGTDIGANQLFQQDWVGPGAVFLINLLNKNSICGYCLIKSGDSFYSSHIFLTPNKSNWLGINLNQQHITSVDHLAD